MIVYVLMTWTLSIWDKLVWDISNNGHALSLTLKHAYNETFFVNISQKLLKNGSSKNVSLLPDSLTSSPAVEPGRASTGPGVQLKSLRPKGSMANLRYQLPLKPDPGKGNG